MKNLITKIKGSYSHIPYTWSHWKAFRKLENELWKNTKPDQRWKKHYFHDWDKLVMYAIIPWVGDDWIGKHHRKTRSHHPGNIIGTVDWIEAVIDWECARITKPDKPLNARGTLEKYYSEFRVEAEPVINMLNL